MMENNTTSSECTMQRSPFVEPNASRIVRAIIMAVIILVSLTGNYTVCRIIWRKNLFSYRLVVSLSIAELIGTVCYPFLFHYETPPWSWVFGDFMCHVVNPLSVCCGAMVTFTMAAIAVYRCLVITSQFGYISRVVQFAVLVFSWIWATSLALPSSVTRRVVTRQICDEKILRCVEIFPYPDDVNIYTLVLFTCQHAAPLVVMVAAYVVVTVKICKHVHDIRRDLSITDTADTETTGNKTHDLQLNNKYETEGRERFQLAPTTSSSIRPESRHESTMTEREQELLKMIYAIILIYFFCYLPYSVMFVIREFKLVNLYNWDYDYVVSLYSYLLQCLPSALHPIMFLRIRTIHDGAMKFILCR